MAMTDDVKVSWSDSQHAGMAAAERNGTAAPPGTEPNAGPWLARSFQAASRALGERYLRRLTGIPDLRHTAAQLPERMQRAAQQTRLVLELIEDVRKGTYRDLRWYSLPVAAAALLYAVSPADVVPDVIPLLGSVDDVVLLALAVRMLSADLRAYCRFKGYPEEQYFGAPS